MRDDPFDDLRDTTREAHQGLEDALDLLRPPLSRTRFTQVLQGFLGFHEAWEPAIERHSALRPLLDGRDRLAILRADLAALGETPSAIAALPRCADADSLVATLPAAIGSLYVIEGSTLGGRVIGRALAGAPWLPAAGLVYFEPYGDRTGAMWRGFKSAARDLLAPQDWPEVTEGAVRTFDLMRAWLGEAVPVA